jgi:LPLT family lysophospholipid transporter-like MFS transporter
MPAGILIGVAVIFFAVQQALLPAFALLLLLGVFGGFFIVPLNALLQERGKHTVGAGNAIAVQNLGENVAMLLMLGLYSLAVSIGIPPVASGLALARCLPLAIAALWIWGGVNNLGGRALPAPGSHPLRATSGGSPVCAHRGASTAYGAG